MTCRTCINKKASRGIAIRLSPDFTTLTALDMPDTLRRTHSGSERGRKRRSGDDGDASP